MINTILNGRFQTEDIINKGVSGGVYRARDLETGKAVAVKLLFVPPFATDQYGVRFRQEVEVLFKLQHQNIVALIDAGMTDNDILFYAMELLDGRTLAQIVQAEGPIDPVTMANYLDGIAEALDFAHRQDIIHRDIQPSNIFVHNESDVEIPKVLDFGLAKVLNPDPDEASPATGRLRMGKSSYMCPEQLEGKTANATWDVYSIAVTVYYCLTGKLPFDEGGEVATMTAILTKAPPAFRDMNPNNTVNPSVEAVVRQGLAKKQKERPQSAGEFARRFREAVGVAASPQRSRPTTNPVPRPQTTTSTNPAVSLRTSTKTGAFNAAQRRPPTSAMGSASLNTAKASGGSDWMIIGFVVLLVVGIFAALLFVMWG